MIQFIIHNTRIQDNLKFLTKYTGITDECDIALPYLPIYLQM